MKATKSHVIMLTVVIIAVICICICKFTARDSSNQAAVPVPVGPSTEPRMDASNDAERISDDNSRLRTMLLESNVAIEFYGRVIDPNGTPLKGAKVSFRVLMGGDLQPLLGLQRRDGGIVYSGDDGSFRIMDMKGMNLNITTIELEGYRESTGGTCRNYAYGSGSVLHYPDPASPVEFMLIDRKVPIPLEENLRLAFAWDSRPVAVPIGDSKVVLVFVPKRDRASGAIRIFDWSVEMIPEDPELWLTCQRPQMDRRLWSRNPGVQDQGWQVWTDRDQSLR
ncbi:MAG: carboxypeptidase-like regulatory domain-containing protein [Verrucomicrobia bacterium]|nr:carboxypeptidase-like regulatory domain-containing protein [Verrucomicrobiota bacterium]